MPIKSLTMKYYVVIKEVNQSEIQNNDKTLYTLPRSLTSWVRSCGASMSTFSSSANIITKVICTFLWIYDKIKTIECIEAVK